MNTFKKTGNEYRIFRDGSHVYTIRRNPRKGYDKIIIRPDGSELVSPLFSWFPTLKAAFSFCDVKEVTK